MRNLIVENSQQMHIKFRKCVGVEANHLKVLAPAHSPNTDGIHFRASKDMVIKNTIIGKGIINKAIDFSFIRSLKASKFHSLC